MFLQDLTEPQRVAFHNIARQLIYSDEILDINEAQLMAILEREMELSDKEIPTLKNIDESLMVFDTKKSKAIVILELLILAAIDGDFNVDESTFIQKIADSLHIHSIDFTEMKWWAKKKADLDKEAQKFFK
ncbi:MAG: hypothetical protein JXK07_10220 [Spirochaetes bacterium]|nr:hypothetical protein [Spirochaetota bacterium]